MSGFIFVAWIIFGVPLSQRKYHAFFGVLGMLWLNRISGASSSHRYHVCLLKAYNAALTRASSTLLLKYKDLTKMRSLNGAIDDTIAVIHHTI